MKLYNSKTLKLEDFKPIKENEVSMYVCGPTVYNYAHIGNARPVVVFDTLRRTLEALGYTVKYVSNYTDVDDKIIKKANEEQVPEAVITERYIQAYQRVRDCLNTEPLAATPKVTETMDDIIHFINELVEKGYAYQVGGDVYFRVRSVKSYGEVSHQNLEELEAGARIEENSFKEDPFDFALWKDTDMGIKWDSPWGKGRPGWHTECVVMINKEFGGLIDIHGGGMDLKFPHHENEVAQSHAIYEHGLANYWVHNAMISMDGEKMSKSLGNVVLAQDVIDKLGAGLTRWLMLSAHYRKELNFSDETIETARKELDKVLQPLKQASIQLQLHNETGQEIDEEGVQAFLDAMADDLNTPNAMAQIFDTCKKLNGALRQREVVLSDIAKYKNALDKMLWVLGIPYEALHMSEEQKQLYRDWMQAKKDKDFDTADQLRTQLSEQGIL